MGSSIKKLITFFRNNPEYRMSILSNEYFALFVRCRWQSTEDSKLKSLGEYCNISSQLENYYSLPIEQCQRLLKENEDQNVIKVMREFDSWKRIVRISNKRKRIGQKRYTRFDDENLSEKMSREKSSVIYGYLHDGGVAPMDRYARYKENW